MTRPFSKTLRSTAVTATFVLSGALLMSGCAGGKIKSEAKYPTGAQRDGVDANNIYSKRESVFGKDGLSIFGGKKKDEDGGTSGIGVNSFLWRASLDTISFMPLASADPFGGVILTDWYSPPGTQGERFKVNVFILGRELRSDGVRVRAFKQVLQNGAWIDASTSDSTGRDLEDTILTRARQLRIAQVDE